MKSVPLIFAVLLLAACETTIADPLRAARDGSEQPKILILGEDADPDTVPRNSQVFKRALDALANEMNDQGFSVYDETAATLENFTQGRVRRTDAEIIDIARSVKQPPIDVAVIYAIYTQVQAQAQARTPEKGYTNKLQIRVAGRLLNLRDGRRLGNFEVELPQPNTISAGCDRECRLEAVGRNAAVLARDLGAVLAAKLDWLSPPSRRAGHPTPAPEGNSSGLATAYSLLFSGFSPAEMTEIEERITAFSGFAHYRPVDGSLGSNEYWYESSSASARLNRNLRLMLKAMDIAGRVTYGGNQYRVEKIGRRKQR